MEQVHKVTASFQDLCLLPTYTSCNQNTIGKDLGNAGCVLIGARDLGIT